MAYRGFVRKDELKPYIESARTQLSYIRKSRIVISVILECKIPYYLKRKGIEQGIEQGIRNMLSRGKSVEEIVDFCGYSVELVKQVEESMLATSN